MLVGLRLGLGCYDAERKAPLPLISYPFPACLLPFHWPSVHP